MNRLSVIHRLVSARHCPCRSTRTGGSIAERPFQCQRRRSSVRWTDVELFAGCASPAAIRTNRHSHSRSNSPLRFTDWFLPVLVYEGPWHRKESRPHECILQANLSPTCTPVINPFFSASSGALGAAAPNVGLWPSSKCRCWSKFIENRNENR